jgi:hypothetical protein
MEGMIAEQACFVHSVILAYLENSRPQRTVSGASNCVQNNTEEINTTVFLFKSYKFQSRY